MASNYTQNYGLCQWEPEDKFIREEFNQDNEKIDAALKAAEDKAAADSGAVLEQAQSWIQTAQNAAQAAQETADRAISGLEAQGYNLYNLLLQADYESKETGWKKALFFDGFVDGSMTGSMSSGITRSQNRLTVSRTGQGDISLGYSGSGESLVWPLSTKTCTAGGSGTITGIRIKTIHRDGGSGSSTATWKLYVNGVLSSQGTSGTLTFGPTEQEQVISVTSTRVSSGDSFYISVTCGSSALGFFAGSTEGTLGGTILITSSGVTGGTVTSTSMVLPERQRLRGWVRASSATVELSVIGGGQTVPLTKVGSRSTFEPGGTPCTETEFALDQNVPQSDSLYFRLTLDLGNLNTFYVYDYGVLLL